MTESDSGMSIGIDLGTTHLCVGVWQKDRVEIIENDYGKRKTQSCLLFHKKGREIGKWERAQTENLGSCSVYGVKRLIGRCFSDSSVQSDAIEFPFKVVKMYEDKPYIHITSKDDEVLFSPEGISAIMLAEIKELTESYLGRKVKSAVISVPANFNDSQREATRDAATIAGLNVPRIINEPTATAITYCLGRGPVGQASRKRKQKVMIIDLGGGTCDVSLLSILDRTIEVIATAGNTHLGGVDFDNRLVNHCSNKLNKRNKTKITSNAQALRRLRIACERAKHTLSTATSAAIDIPRLQKGINFYTRITRDKFEIISMDLFKGVLELVANVLRDSSTSKSDVDEIILVGGSSRIPKVEQILSSFFKGKQLFKDIDDDEAVAHGAAVQAAILSGSKSAKIKNLKVVDVTAFTVSFRVNDLAMSTLIKRNAAIPTKSQGFLSTLEDRQQGGVIRVYEGEAQNAKDNRLLGEFTVSGIPPASIAAIKVGVTFDINADGILNVSLTNKKVSKKSKLSIITNKGRFVRQHVEKLAAKLAALKAEKKEEKSRAQALFALSDYICALQEMLHESLDEIPSDVYKVLQDKVSEVKKWLDGNKQAKKDITEKKKIEIEVFVRPIINKIYGIQSASNLNTSGGSQSTSSSVISRRRLSLVPSESSDETPYMLSDNDDDN